MQQGGAVAMIICSTTSSMNNKISNKFKINGKPRKKHWSFTGRALQISPTALQNHRTTAVLTNSTVTANPMNNAQQRGGKYANSETCRRNGRTEQGSDRKPLPQLENTWRTSRSRSRHAGMGLSTRTIGSRRGHAEE